MTEPELYSRIDRNEAIELFGGPRPTQQLCKGQWVILQDYILCFATVGGQASFSRFESGSRFCWVANERSHNCIPTAVLAISNDERPIRLFVRRDGEESYLYAGRLDQSHSWGEGKGNFAEAYFNLEPILPSAIWNELAGLTLDDPEPAALDLELDQLGSQPSSTALLEILRHVVEYFHGLIPPEDGLNEKVLSDISMKIDLPNSLLWWYRFVGNRQGMLCHQNRFISPEDLKVDMEGHTIFFCENQGVYLWSIKSCDTVLDDPPVWGRINEPGTPWLLEGMKLSEFLVQACLFEAILKAPYRASASWVNQEILDLATKPLKQIQIAPWHWPCFPTLFFYGNGAFVVACPNGVVDDEQGFSIWIGAKTEQAVAYLKGILRGCG